MSEPESTATSDTQDGFAPLVRTMLRGFRAADRMAMAALREAGFNGSGPASWYLLSAIPEEGGRASVLARELGVSKQAVGQALRELERSGYVEKEVDPDDRRAFRIHATSRGRHVVEAGVAALRSQEAQWGSELGRTRFEALRATLEEFTSFLEDRGR